MKSASRQAMCGALHFGAHYSASLAPKKRRAGSDERQMSAMRIRAPRKFLFNNINSIQIFG
jgi:hypothetical protein